MHARSEQHSNQHGDIAPKLDAGGNVIMLWYNFWLIWARYDPVHRKAQYDPVMFVETQRYPSNVSTDV